MPTDRALNRGFLIAADWTLRYGAGLAFLTYPQSVKYHSMFPEGFDSDEERCLALCFLSAIESYRGRR